MATFFRHFDGQAYLFLRLNKYVGTYNFSTTSISNCWQIVLTVKELLLALHKTAVFGNMFELNLKLEWVDFCSEKADSN